MLKDGRDRQNWTVTTSAQNLDAEYHYTMSRFEIGLDGKIRTCVNLFPGQVDSLYPTSRKIGASGESWTRTPLFKRQVL